MTSARAYTVPSIHIVQIEDDDGNLSYQFMPTGFRARAMASEINGRETPVKSHEALLPKKRVKKDEKKS